MKVPCCDGIVQENEDASEGRSRCESRNPGSHLERTHCIRAATSVPSPPSLACRLSSSPPLVFLSCLDSLIYAFSFSLLSTFCVTYFSTSSRLHPCAHPPPHRIFPLRPNLCDLPELLRLAPLRPHRLVFTASSLGPLRNSPPSSSLRPSRCQASGVTPSRSPTRLQVPRRTSRGPSKWIHSWTRSHCRHSHRRALQPRRLRQMQSRRRKRREGVGSGTGFGCLSPFSCRRPGRRSSPLSERTLGEGRSETIAHYRYRR